MMTPKGNPGAISRRLRNVTMILMIVLLVVLHDVADLAGQTGEYRPDRPEDGVRVSATEDQGSDQDRGKDIVADEKDLERLYRELLTKKKKEEDNTTTLKAAENCFYRIYLLNGRILLADTIKLSGNAITADDRGVVVHLNRNEIAGIERIDGRREDHREK
jgi:hypothetical protein